MVGRTMALFLKAIAHSLPDLHLKNSDFPGLDVLSSRMFQGTRERYQVGRNDSVVELFARAAEKLSPEARAELASVDTLLTNVSVPDLPFTGCGAMVAERLGIRPNTVLDLHNGGCISFILMMDLARALMQTHGAKKILICSGQTAAGRIFPFEQMKNKPQAALYGDAVSLAIFSDEGILQLENVIWRCHPEFSADMTLDFEDGRKYWEPGTALATLEYKDKKTKSVILRGNRMVPEAMKLVLEKQGIDAHSLSALVTNQPNTLFLEAWRNSLELPEEKHFHTFAEFANLFQAGIPINLERAIESGKLQPGSWVMLSGFSHAADYSAAALMRVPQ